MITLYHGSNTAFSVPDLSVGRQGMDFGKGFYLTPNSGTAQKMAERVTRIRGRAIMCYTTPIEKQEKDSR